MHIIYSMRIIVLIQQGKIHKYAYRNVIICVSLHSYYTFNRRFMLNITLLITTIKDWVVKLNRDHYQIYTCHSSQDPNNSYCIVLYLAWVFSRASWWFIKLVCIHRIRCWIRPNFYGWVRKNFFNVCVFCIFLYLSSRELNFSCVRIVESRTELAEASWPEFQALSFPALLFQSEHPTSRLLLLACSPGWLVSLLHLIRGFGVRIL